jgi:His/Glu/Gln/Arg/opine family amino acid ABC transporter permease subunit
VDLGIVWASLPRLLEGATVTAQLVSAALVIGFLLAVPLALMRVSRRPWLAWPAYAYVFFFRGTPLLVQIFLVYYGLGQFQAVRESALWPVLREADWCAILAFGLNTAAYTGEILRGGILGVPRGEVDAARAIGMSGPLLFRRIVFPRAFRLALPAYGNEVILMLKASSLASTITILEVTGAARSVIARTFAPIEVFLAAGGIYLAINFVVTRVFRLVERRLTPAPGRPASRRAVASKAA